MPKPLLATSEDLRNFLGTEEIDRARADFILGGVCSAVRSFTNDQSFEGVETDIVTLDGSGTSVVLMPYLPVRDVLAVTESGVLLDESSYDWSESGILQKRSGYWLQRFRNVTVQYQHGYSEVPEDVRLLVVRVAARAVVNPTAVTQESQGGTSAGYGFDTSRMPVLTEADKEVLRPFMGTS